MEERFINPIKNGNKFVVQLIRALVLKEGRKGSNNNEKDSN